MREIKDGTLVFVRSGLFWLRNGGERFLLDANYLAFAISGDTIAPCGSVEPCECTALQFAGEAFRGAPLHARCALSSPGTHLRQATLLKDGRIAGGIPGADAFTLLAQSLEDLTADPDRREPQSETVQSMRAFLSRSFSLRVSLGQLAEKFYLSPFTVSKTFHRETGISLRAYLQRLRLRNALNAMVAGGSGLAGIAVDAGFYDEPHFSRAFRAEFGRPPARALERL